MPRLDKKPPPLFLVHLALAFGQAGFGVGSIVGKFALRSNNPMLFAFCRNLCAAPLLMLAAKKQTGVVFPPRQDVPRLAAAGLAIALCQLFYMLGIQLSNPVLGAA